MQIVGRAFERIASALIVAGGVTVIAAGLLAYTAPVSGGSGAGASTPPRPTASGLTPSPAPSPGSSATPTPSAGASPAAGVPTRVVVPALKIDLGVYPSTYPGGVSYPLCGVSQYFVPSAGNAAYKLGLPGQPGRSTYIYAHARTGMFLPFLQASLVNDGQSLLGDLVQLYTSDGKVYLYEIFQVKRHTRDFTLPASVPAGTQWLILQTSEGPNYTYPKLQVAASLLSVEPADPSATRPTTTPAPSCPGS